MPILARKIERDQRRRLIIRINYAVIGSTRSNDWRYRLFTVIYFRAVTATRSISRWCSQRAATINTRAWERNSLRDRTNVEHPFDIFIYCDLSFTRFYENLYTWTRVGRSFEIFIVVIMIHFPYKFRGGNRTFSRGSHCGLFHQNFNFASQNFREKETDSSDFSGCGATTLQTAISVKLPIKSCLLKKREIISRGSLKEISIRESTSHLPDYSVDPPNQISAAPSESGYDRDKSNLNSEFAVAVSNRRFRKMSRIIAFNSLSMYCDRGMHLQMICR